VRFGFQLPNTSGSQRINDTPLRDNQSTIANKPFLSNEALAISRAFVVLAGLCVSVSGMGKHIHKLSQINAGKRTAVCANCGPVKITRHNKNGWRCYPANRKFEKLGRGGKREEKRRILELQKKRCAICRTKITMRSSCLDHCHRANEIRGVLCFDCNLGLGRFHDNLERLRAAISYLKN
jgi:hypothetical protein